MVEAAGSWGDLGARRLAAGAAAWHSRSMTTTMLAVLSVVLLALVVINQFSIRYWRERAQDLLRDLDLERAEKMRLYWECRALEEDTNARTAATLRADIAVVARHRDELRAVLTENVEEMDRMRERLKHAESRAADSQVEGLQ